ncbi:MAG: tRNA (N6-threonylcarbamoyladenosine(37)-N6)-methyltransferase TrmO [Anaerolineae bacterium]|nr:tRNA (N6-threonylcarbamoyladenosine(37)-N6)-methyltransferase TrmO [Anaerolineae bacterium]
MEVVYRPIGIVHSPFEDVEGMPIQPSGARGVEGWIEVYPDYVAGLADLEGFSHIVLLYHFHQVTQMQLVVRPFLDGEPRGVFATRAPKRPNPIGLSVVRLVRVEGATLWIEGVDVLNGTPLLDLKPYVPAFDHHPVERTGWLDGKGDAAHRQRSDGRFR